MARLKTLAWAALFLAGAGWAAAAGKPLADLAAGSYEVRVDGMLCTTCARVIAEELLTLKEVEKAAATFDQETVFVTVRLDKTLKISKLRKALSRAARRVDLKTQFEIANIRYRLDTKDKGERPAPKKKG